MERDEYLKGLGSIFQVDGWIELGLDFEEGARGRRVIKDLLLEIGEDGEPKVVLRPVQEQGRSWSGVRIFRTFSTI